MSGQSPRLGISYLAPQQAQKHVTVNEALRALDALVQVSVKSLSLAAEPAAPAEGDCYLIPAGASGANWSGAAANSLAAFADGQWFFFAPKAGWRAFVQDIRSLRVFDGAAWVKEQALGEEAQFSKISVDRSALLENRFTVDGNYQICGFDTFSPTSWHALFMQSRRARGTKAAPAAVQNGDTVFAFDMWGFDGAGNTRLGQLGFEVVGAVSPGVVPGSFVVRLTDTAGAYREVARMTPAGDLGVGVAAPTARLHVDGAARVKSYAKASLPSAAGQGAGAILYVSDEAGGATLAFSDGAQWRRVADRAVVS